MRVGTHVDALAALESGWPHMVKEDERTDVAQFRCRQDASNCKSAEIAVAWFDYGGDRFVHCKFPRLARWLKPR